MEDPTQQQAMGSMSDANVTWFEASRRLEYLQQHKEKKESQKVKKNELPRIAKGKEGKRAKTRNERG